MQEQPWVRTVAGTVGGRQEEREESSTPVNQPGERSQGSGEGRERTKLASSPLPNHPRRGESWEWPESVYGLMGEREEGRVTCWLRRREGSEQEQLERRGREGGSASASHPQNCLLIRCTPSERTKRLDYPLVHLPPPPTPSHHFSSLEAPFLRRLVQHTLGTAEDDFKDDGERSGMLTPFLHAV